MALIKSGASSDNLTIDTNKSAYVNVRDGAGGAAILAEGSQPSTVYGLTTMGANDGRVIPIRVDRFGSMASALHMPLMHESFEGTTTHPLRWLITNTTMAAAQTTVGGLVFNSGAITTITTGYMIKSTRLLMKTQRSPLQVKFRARLAHINNSVMELGFGDAATFNGANTVGAYWQKTSSGALQPVLTYNSVDQTGTDISAFVSSSNYYTFDIVIDDDEAIFYCQNTATGALVAPPQSLKLPVTGQRLLSATQVPIMVRLYNTGSAPASASQLILNDIYAMALDSNVNAPLSHIQSLQSRTTLENPFTGTQLATFANSAAPSNATLSNTAAGYTTLGGLFSFAAVAGAATDYALFGFTVPTPATLVVTGISIETWNTGAAVATTPTLLVWGLATQLTAVSLATGSHVRLGLGAQQLPVAAAVGAKAERIDKVFQTPIICSPGRFFDVILRMPVGTATASQVIQGMVNIDGYFI